VAKVETKSQTETMAEIVRVIAMVTRVNSVTICIEVAVVI
jgi:hypothetical protein